MPTIVKTILEFQEQLYRQTGHSFTRLTFSDQLFNRFISEANNLLLITWSKDRPSKPKWAILNGPVGPITIYPESYTVTPLKR